MKKQKVTLIYGEEEIELEAEKGQLLGDIIATTDLPLEQPCAGRGTCGLCKVINEGGLTEPDEVELEHLLPGEITVGTRLACRARIQDDTSVMLTPVAVYSNKAFRGSSRFKREKDIPLGLAIDLGTTTVAAYITMMDNGEVCAGAATLNQQAVFGADIISRLDSATKDPVIAERLHKLALASINHAIDALKLSKNILKRVEVLTIVGNPAMHHLLAKLPVNILAVSPFQPVSNLAIKDANKLLGDFFPGHAQVNLPPLVGGFVGSDALACLAYFGFDNPPGPIAAIDLGTNGEVMVTDGKRILTGSTAAGPAFEGVNISCGCRAVDGAIVDVNILDEEIQFKTIADAPPVGLTGSGLISAIHEFCKIGLIHESGKINVESPYFEKWGTQKNKIRAIHIDQGANIFITQKDIRELQKAKGAIWATTEILMKKLDLSPEDLQKIYLTGSFGGKIEVDSAIGIGMIPRVNKEVIESVANGAGFGAALFLSDSGFALGEKIAAEAEQIDLDRAADFTKLFIDALKLGEV